VTVDQILQQEIKATEVWLSREKDESTYKRDLKKKIELINWVLEDMKNPDIKICNLIESKMNEIILTINKTYSIFESDKLHSELNEFIKLKYTLLCSSYTCIQFMLGITFLELILFLNHFYA
jgi:hypothetical protein